MLECVPNFSEGRDRNVVVSLLDTVRAAGAEILDWSMDPDHHRSVLTFVGDPSTVAEAAVDVTLHASRLIDLTRHSGVHPRIGATDVLPFVPLFGATMTEAAALARAVGTALADEGVPVYLYGAASEGPPRPLADIRRGGFETLVKGWPSARIPDYLPQPWPHPGAHPTAGATCVGARTLLLAWNVYVEGLESRDLKVIASGIRETGGGFMGLRALALELPRQGRSQISMNLENLENTSPFDVFEAIEAEVQSRGGSVSGTEVIGMVPDGLVLPAAADRLALENHDADRLLSRRLSGWLAARTEGAR